MAKITLDGNTLTLDALYDFSQAAEIPGEPLEIDIAAEAKERITRAADFVQKLAGSGETVYGLNTGFGHFARTRIDDAEITELQRNIIRSHSCGVGEELSRRQVLAMWVVLLNSVCRGHRGLSLQSLETILAGLRAGILACVPARGSVGASGDLAPSAHAVLAALGEGECTAPRGHGFVRLSAADALKSADLTALELGPKEGLCLINGTQLTAALAAELCLQSESLLAHANLATAMMIEGLRGSHHMTDTPLLEEQRQEGTLACGNEIAAWLQGETGISKSHTDCDRVQDSYSLRCAPQVHGMVWEELQQARRILSREINATTDNPILFPRRGLVIHGGNFHAIYPARMCDHLAAALTTLATISERRINIAMRQDKSGLPTFLIENGGLNSGFMMVQVTAAALASECKSLSFPASADSIPTNNDQEDHVSMGPGAALKALQVLEKARYVTAIELLIAAQGIDMLRPLKTSARLEAVHAKIREKVNYLDKDRFLTPDIEAVNALVREGNLIK